LRTTPIVAGRSLDQFAQSILAAVGKDISRSETEMKATQAAFDQISQQQQSVSGVSTDEELAYLAQTQRAYQAAARIVSVANDLLGIIIEQMGVS
jgi:flagellar hook-associated protein 1 FlgK